MWVCICTCTTNKKKKNRYFFPYHRHRRILYSTYNYLFKIMTVASFLSSLKLSSHPSIHLFLCPAARQTHVLGYRILRESGDASGPLFITLSKHSSYVYLGALDIDACLMVSLLLSRAKPKLQRLPSFPFSACLHVSAIEALYTHLCAPGALSR